MDFLQNLYKKSLPQPSPQKLQTFPHEKKMQYILQKIKSTHEKLMSEISQEFEERIEYEQNVCYDQYREDIERYANCAYAVGKQGDARVEVYKKKIAFISFVASRCLLEGSRRTVECKDQALEKAKEIMNEELQYIKTWNPHLTPNTLAL